MADNRSDLINKHNRGTGASGGSMGFGEEEKKYDEDGVQDEEEYEYDMRYGKWRFFMIFLAWLFVMGVYFSYDTPSVIQQAIEEAFGNTPGLWAHLYTIYSAPNVILPVLGGMYCDKMGIRKGILTFSLIVTFGQTLFFMGGYFESYALMMVGRIIFGFGGESLKVAQYTIIYIWFRGQELNYAMGLTLGISHFGSVFSSWIVPQIAKEHGLGTALLVGWIICLVSLLAALILCYLDKKADSQSVEESLLEEDKFQIRDLLNLGVSFWLLAISSIFIYGTVWPYMQTVVKKLIEGYGFANTEAALLFGVPFLVSAIVCPIIGLVSDKCGRRMQFIMVAHLILILAFIISIAIPGCNDGDKCYHEFVPLFLIGIGYSIYISIFYASIPLLVEHKNVGSAYGIAQIFQNIALLYTPWQISRIINDEEGHGNYLGANIFYISINTVGLLMAIVLYCYDMRKCEGVLNWPVYYYYDGEYDEYGEEDGEEVGRGSGVNDDQKSTNKKLGVPKKKMSTTSGMSFNSNVRSQKTGQKRTVVSMRSKKKPVDMQSDKQSMNSYMKRNAGVLLKIRGALQGKVQEEMDDGMDFGASSDGKGQGSAGKKIAANKKETIVSESEYDEDVSEYDPNRF